MEKMIRIMLGKDIYAIAVDAKALVEQARNIHAASPVATAAIGRLMMGALIIASDIEQPEGDVTLSIDGGGLTGKLIAVAQPDGGVRAYVQNPSIDLPLRKDGKLDVGAAVGTDGMLSVIKDTGGDKPYIGQCMLASGEIAEDITLYYFMSEQKPAVVYLGVVVDKDGVRAAGGLMAFPLPGCSEEALSMLEQHVPECAKLSSMLHAGKELEQACGEIFSDMDMRITQTSGIEYRCTCSTERMQRALISLGRLEMEDIISEDGHAEIVCHFCGNKYDFNAEELSALLAQAKGEQPMAQ